MKKNILFRTIAAALMSSVVIAMMPVSISYAYTETSGTIVPASAKIRDAAGSSSNVIGSAVKGTEVTIVDEAKDDSGTVWYKVSVNGNSGYIRSDLITKGAASSDSDEKADDSKSTDTKSTDTKSTDTKSTDTKSTDTKSTDTKSTDTKSTDTKSTETKAAASPTTIDGTGFDVSTVTLPDGVTAADAQYISVNVASGKIRSDASTSADIVDTLTKGSTMIAVGTKNDDSGKSWYYTVFTGNDGSQKNGFIRSDLITAGDALPKSDTTAETETAATEESTEAANNDYQLVYADDGTGSGTSVWYLYDNKNGTRMKADELMEYVTAQPTKEKENEVKIKQYRMIMIILGVAAAAFLVGLIILGIKLRDSEYEYDPDDDDDDDDDDLRQPHRSTRSNDDSEKRRMRESEERSQHRMRGDSYGTDRKQRGSADERRPRRRDVESDRMEDEDTGRMGRRQHDDAERSQRGSDEAGRPQRRSRDDAYTDRSQRRSRDEADRPQRRSRDDSFTEDRPQRRTRDEADRPQRRSRDDSFTEDRSQRMGRNDDDLSDRRSGDVPQGSDADQDRSDSRPQARKAKNFISDDTDDMDFEFINIDDNDK